MPLMKLPKVFLMLFTLAILSQIMTIQAQEDTTPKKRLQSPVTVNGFIGGESHDSYVIHVRKNQVLTVQISWKPEGNNTASFTVSESPNFYSSQPVKFGKTTNGGKRWAGKIPKTSDYYIAVIAYPTAHYTLKVSLQ
jgi:hypothetical protein